MYQDYCAIDLGSVTVVNQGPILSIDGDLYDNPLLKRPLALADVKHMLLGHWGTTPGQNFIYVHLNRIIKKYDLNMIYVSGPGHGGPAVVGNTYLEGTYSEIYPDISLSPSVGSRPEHWH